MLQKISRIKNLGIFADYTWERTLPTFERYNVIYGDNGSGKTTLSRLMDSLSAGGNSEYPKLEYKIEGESGEYVHGSAASRQVRVFNSDYVQANIGQLDGSLKPILVLGEENKALAESLEADEAAMERRKAAIASTEVGISKLEDTRGKKFSAIASTISEATSGTTARTYRKNNAETAYRGLAATQSLTDDQLNTHRSTVRQEIMEAVSKPPSLAVILGSRELTLQLQGDSIAGKASELCARSVMAKSIARLRDNSDIALWAEQGLGLHARHQHGQCEFCGQTISEERWRALEAHFSAEDQQLKQEIEDTLAYSQALRSRIASIALPDRLALYSDFRQRYDAALQIFNRAVRQAAEELDAVEGSLKVKQAARATVQAFSMKLSLGSVDSALSAICEILDEHNAKSAGFDAAKAVARDEIEAHHLLSIKADVVALDEEIARLKGAVQIATDGAEGEPALSELQSAIDAKRVQLLNAHKAGAELTGRLQTFLGRSELVFHSSDEGYRVHRNGKPAKKLSEGERTAIAFIYFVVQLSERDFSLADAVIVIDDPVSSLDSSSVYQAFALLKNAVKGAKQVFLLTHNFGFLRLVLDWLKNDHKSKKQYYMLVCHTSDAGRRSKLVTLDKALIEHPTEYHFLFKTLYTFNGDGTIAQCYHIPNVARKVLETFLDFYVPGNQNLFRKLEAVSFDATKKTAIYKFTNDNSHFTGQGFEPGLIQESQKNVAYLLEMIEALAPQHFAGMKAVSA